MSYQRAMVAMNPTAKQRVLRKFPSAHVVWSHGGRVVLLYTTHSPTHFSKTVRAAWEYAAEQLI